jgi:hypothetical protein
MQSSVKWADLLHPVSYNERETDHSACINTTTILNSILEFPTEYSADRDEFTFTVKEMLQVPIIVVKGKTKGERICHS